MLTVLHKFDSVIARLSSFTVHTNYLGFARSILALSLCLTLLVTDMYVLYYPGDTEFGADKSVFLITRINFFYLFSYEYLNLAKWITIVLLLVIISGWRPRFTCLIHAWIQLSFINSATVIEGGDQLASNICLMLVPICLLDNRKWHWQPSAERFSGYGIYSALISNFFYVMIRVQVAMVYFHSAIGKLFVEEWKNGTALYYWFNDPTFGMQTWMKPIVNPLLANPYVVVGLTWGVIAFEMLLFMALVMPTKFWRPLLILGLGFHFMIIVFHGLFSFFITMIGALILYLAPVWKQWRRKEVRSPIIAAN